MIINKKHVSLNMLFKRYKIVFYIFCYFVLSSIQSYASILEIDSIERKGMLNIFDVNNCFYYTSTDVTNIHDIINCKTCFTQLDKKDKYSIKPKEYWIKIPVRNSDSVSKRIYIITSNNDYVTLYKHSNHVISKTYNGFLRPTNLLLDKTAYNINYVDIESMHSVVIYINIYNKYKHITGNHIHIFTKDYYQQYLNSYFEINYINTIERLLFIGAIAFILLFVLVFFYFNNN